MADYFGNESFAGGSRPPVIVWELPALVDRDRDQVVFQGAGQRAVALV